MDRRKARLNRHPLIKLQLLILIWGLFLLAIPVNFGLIKLDHLGRLNIAIPARILFQSIFVLSGFMSAIVFYRRWSALSPETKLWS